MWTGCGLEDVGVTQKVFSVLIILFLVYFYECFIQK